MRKVVKPLEGLLTSHKRIVVKDSAVSRKRERERERVIYKQRLFLLSLSSLPYLGECGVLWSQGSSPWSAAV